MNWLNRMHRRDWLRTGGAAACASIVPSLLAAREASARDKARAPRAERAILIYLQGGISHYESFDPKPEAPAEYRGEFGSISTSVPGTIFTEHLPNLAKRAHKFSVVRSAYVDSPGHPEAIHMTLTGYNLVGADVAGKNRNTINPAIGSVVARFREPNKPGMPRYVAVPHCGQLGARVHYGTSGMLGPVYEPVDSGLPPSDIYGSFTGPRDLTLQAGLELNRVNQRLELLKAIEHPRGDAAGADLDRFQRQAYEMLASSAASRAFDLSREPLRERERYGNHLFGQQTILARRLAESGVPFTMVNYTLTQHFGQDWDTHVDNFNLMRNTLLPPMDVAVSALLDDLEERGLLDTTLVAMYGEFGRTPQINAKAGRDHWHNVCSVFLTGGGIKPGIIVGSSTKNGAEPFDRPVHFNDILATIYHLLGVPTDFVLQDPLGRPIPVLDRGRPVPELL